MKRRSGDHGFTLIEMLIVIAIIGILMALLIPTIIKALDHGHEVAGYEMVKRITFALQHYSEAYGTYPPGPDGSTGSKNLVDYLNKPGARRQPFLELDAGEITPNGRIRNPILPDEIVEYLWPGVHNRTRPDIFMKDSEGQDKGINNWQK